MSLIDKIVEHYKDHQNVYNFFILGALTVGAASVLSSDDEEDCYRGPWYSGDGNSNSNINIDYD